MSADSTTIFSTASSTTANVAGTIPPPCTPVDDAPTIHGLANAGGLAAGFAAHGIPPDTEEDKAAGTATSPLSADDMDTQTLEYKVGELERKLKVKHAELTAIFALYHRIYDKPAEMRVRSPFPFPLTLTSRVTTDKPGRCRGYPPPLRHTLLHPPARARTRLESQQRAPRRTGRPDLRANLRLQRQARLGHARRESQEAQR